MVAGGVEGHQHHGGGVGVAGVEVGARVGIVADVEVVPTAITVLGVVEEGERTGRDGSGGGDQSLDGERLGERLAVPEGAGGGVPVGGETADQVEAGEGDRVPAGGDDCLDQLPAGAGGGARVSDQAAGGGGVGGQVVDDRGPAVSEHVGVVAGGGGADGVELTGPEAARAGGDRPIRRRLL